MTDEELDRARGREAVKIGQIPPKMLSMATLIAEQAARLGREGWMPDGRATLCARKSVLPSA